jgi:uncharacterized protein YlzI (FlbEa/FlbD family)
MPLKTPTFTNIDIEDIITTIKALLNDNINTYITQMNSVKSDITLSTLNSSAYIIQSQNQDINYDPFILIREENTESDHRGTESSQKSTIEVFIVFTSSGDANDVTWKKVLRYRRILRELFQNGWQSIYNGQVISNINNLPQTAIVLMNSTSIYTGAGVSLELNYA